MDKNTLSIEKAIEVGIGLAEEDPHCHLCTHPRRQGACPEHAAANVLRMLREYGYVGGVS